MAARMNERAADEERNEGSRVTDSRVPRLSTEPPRCESCVLCVRAHRKYQRFSARKNCVRKLRGKLNVHLLIRSALLKGKLISVTLFFVLADVNVIYIYICIKGIKRKKTKEINIAGIIKLATRVIESIELKNSK